MEWVWFGRVSGMGLFLGIRRWRGILDEGEWRERALIACACALGPTFLPATLHPSVQPIPKTSESVLHPLPT